LFYIWGMKKGVVVLLVVFSWMCGWGQNLVPNFSFEQNDSCPTNENQIRYALGWSNYRYATPDYYNSCSPPDSFGVPYSMFSHQDEPRNCNAYAGLVTYATPHNWYREMIGVQLSQPLVIGQKYFLSFYTVMSEYYLNGIQYGMPSNNIGIRLSTIQYTQSNPCPYDNFAHLRSVAVIDDSVNWHRISGSITADSAYNYLILGNFFDDANTDTIHYSCSSCLNYGSYYLVDDICLSTDSFLCNGGLDTLPCVTSINELNKIAKFNIYPNPASFNSPFTFTYPSTSAKKEIIIYSIHGKEIARYALPQWSSTQTVKLPQMAGGVYVARMVGEGVSANLKFVVK
jgi:hypothetical protein